MRYNRIIVNEAAAVMQFVLHLNVALYKSKEKNKRCRKQPLLLLCFVPSIERLENVIVISALVLIIYVIF